MRNIPIIIALFAVLLSCAGNTYNVSQDTLLADEGYQELIKGNYESAEAILNVALSIDPNNPYALLNLGVLFQNTGRLEEARATYRRLVELNPEDIAADSTSGKFKGKKLVEIAKENLSTLNQYK
jgi:general secretion pathway protein D